MDNYEYVKVESLNLTGKLEKKVHYRSNISIAVCALFGIAILFAPSIIAKILGVFFIIMAIVVVALVKDVPTLDVYDDGVLVYYTKDQSMGVFLPFDKMVEFEGKNDNGAEAIKFVMDNEQIIFKDTFNTGDALRAIRKNAQDKEKREILKKEFEQNLAESNPFKRLFKKKK